MIVTLQHGLHVITYWYVKLDHTNVQHPILFFYSFGNTLSLFTIVTANQSRDECVGSFVNRNIACANEVLTIQPTTREKEKEQTFPLPNISMSACSYRMDIDFRISYMLPSSARSVHGQSWFILIAVLCFAVSITTALCPAVFSGGLPPGTGCASPACVCDCVFCISGSRKKGPFFPQCELCLAYWNLQRWRGQFCRGCRWRSCSMFSVLERGVSLCLGWWWWVLVFNSLHALF